MIDGPKIGAASNAPDSLVILCHGYGADGNDLLSLAPYWQKILPNTAFIAPNAPEPCGSGGAGYQWFPYFPDNRDKTASGLPTAAVILNEFITAQLDAFGLDESRLALVGFSQGTILSLYVGPRRAIAPAAIIGFSGALIFPEELSKTKSRPPVLLVHGDSDAMIPASETRNAYLKLLVENFACEYHISKNCGHSILPEGLELAGKFLARHLKS